MTSLRRLLHDRPTLAALVIAMALFMRLALPAGTMLTSDRMVLTVTICADATMGPQTRQIVIPTAPSGSEKHQQSKDGAACPFSALSTAMLGADGLLLALALLVVFAAALRPARALKLAAARGLRPPSRAPPVLG